jgi:hypothetical protein
MLLLFILLGIVGWGVISVPVALLFARIFNFGEDQAASASTPGAVELESLDPDLPAGADLAWGGSADRFAEAG